MKTNRSLNYDCEMNVIFASVEKWCPGWESNPHEEKSPEDFKSSASAIPPPGRWHYKFNQRARFLQHCRSAPTSEFTHFSKQQTRAFFHARTLAVETAVFEHAVKKRRISNWQRSQPALYICQEFFPFTPCPSAALRKTKYQVSAKLRKNPSRPSTRS